MQLKHIKHNFSVRECNYKVPIGFISQCNIAPRRLSRSYSNMNFEPPTPVPRPRNRSSQGQYADSGTGSLSTFSEFSDRGDDHPLLLIEFKRENGVNNRLHLMLNHELLDEVLKTCQNKKICSVFVTGPVRTGKSFILNCIMDKLQDMENDRKYYPRQNKEIRGFHYKNGEQSHTKGIWVWSRAFCITTNADEVAVLLFDTEGIDDELSKPDEIFAILGFSLLASSLLIFNTSGNISPSELGWILPLCERADSEQLPEVSVVIRDWTDFDTFQYNGTSYFETVLRHKSISNHSQIEWNCTVLPHIGEYALSKDFRGREAVLDKAFKHHVDLYLKKILNTRNLSIKSLFRNEFTISEYAFFFDEAVDLIDSALDPCNNLEAIDIWSALNECVEKFKIQKGVKEYTDWFHEMQQFAPRGYLPESLIENNHREAQEKAIQAFKAFRFRPTEETRMLNMLKQKLDDLNTELKNKNASVRNSNFERALQDTVQTFKEEIHARFSFSSYDHSMEDADLLHYDESLLTEQIDLEKQKAETCFLSAFPGVGAEEKHRLLTSLRKTLAKLTDDILRKNDDNCRKAREKARDLTDKFMNKYEAAMQSHFCTQKLDSINEVILQGLHYLEMKRIENELDCIKLGSANFTMEIVNRIKSSIHGRLEDFKQNLKPTANAMSVHTNPEYQEYPYQNQTDAGMGTALQYQDLSPDNFENLRPIVNVNRLSGETYMLARTLSKDVIEDDVLTRAPAFSQAKQEQETRASSSAEKYLSELQTSLDNILQRVENMTLSECTNFASAEYKKILTDFDSDLRSYNLDQEKFQHINSSFSKAAKLTHEKFGEQLLLASQRTANLLNDRNQKLTLEKAITEATEEFNKEIEKRKVKLGPGGYFSDAELQQASEIICNNILSRLSKNYDLNSTQRNQLEEVLSVLSKKIKEQNEVCRRTFDDDIAIGIDLGTTYCCVAAYYKGKVEILRNSHGDNTTPSYVLINKNGSTTVGSSAKNKAFRNPEATIYDAKRIIGRRPGDPKLQEDMKFWPFNVKEIGGDVCIEVHGKDYHPEEISSMILNHLKENAEKVLGREIKKAVITVPAYFTDGQRQATIEAGTIAGIEVLGILNEPTAAALAYRLECFDVGRKRNILVYDFGGGTFDVSILSLSDTEINVLGISGDTHLGGEDIDKNLMKHCAGSFQSETGIDLFEGKDDENRNIRNDARRRLNRLQNECENAKKSISDANTAEALGEVSLDTFANGEDLLVEITRNTFDEINFDLYEQTIKITENALNSAELTTRDIDDVVMVGGSTRIKKVQELLSKYFGGKTLCNRLNPDEAIAYGAAVQAALLNCKPGQKPFDFGTIKEVTPMSVGVQLMDKSMDILIPKNTKIPATHTEEYKTHVDGQTSVTIPIYQGENDNTDMNTLLGTFHLKGIPPGPAGSEIVDVTMKININGTLTVEAVCRSTKGKTSLTISDDRGGYSKAKKERHLPEAEG